MTQGHQVDGWVHSTASADTLAGAGFHRLIIGNVGASVIWDQIDRDYDQVIHCASSSRGGPEAYQEVFLWGGMLMNQRQPRARRLMISSTSVYGQVGGELVNEESTAEPGTETGKILRAAETNALEAGVTVVRSSGIYGPGRAALWEKFRRGDAVIEGDGLRWINQIHQRDLVQALFHLIDHGEAGQIYNATDHCPVTQLDFYTWCSDFLRQPMPPYGPVNTQRKRGLTNKRVSNAKLCATGWAPVYPSFREGLRADYSPR